MSTKRVANCDVCGKDLAGKPFVDGRMHSGQWANMCLLCFQMFGTGLGIGRGQKYDADGKKVGG